MNMDAEIGYRITLYHKGDEAGYIQLVFYYNNINLPHIEYEIKPEYRRLGIMSRDLPKYLNFCENLEYEAFVALVKNDNIASKKLLLKNKFTKIASRKDDIEIYLFSPKLNKIAKEVLDLTLEAVSNNYVK